MPSYLIQKRIHTLVEYGLYNDNGPLPFTRDNIQFSSWQPDAWRTRFWLAQSTLQADNFISAWKAFQARLTRIVVRTAFVGQAYHTDIGQPYLIKKADSELAYFRHSQDSQPVPLHFSEEELGSLDILLADTDIPHAFYLYWNDAVNAVGYTAKLVLMFAALEILFEKASRSRRQRMTQRSPSKRQVKRRFYAAARKVFGADLKKQLYGTAKDSRSGLRQRLVHGDYLSENDTENYVEIIHKTIVRHFNQCMLQQHPVHEAVVNPQRHLFGNLEGWQGYVRPETNAPLLLKPVHEAFQADDMNPRGYDIVPPDERPKNY